MPGRRFQFGDYVVDFDSCELHKRGQRINLQRKPFRVLELLLRCPGELVTRKELVEFLWPDSHVSFEHGLNTAVNSLRLALGEYSRESRFIETRPGFGYRFVSPLKQIKGDEKFEDWSVAKGNTGAQADCMKGRYLLDEMCEEDAYKSLGFFTAAALDENCCSLAHAGIADVYCQLAQLGWAPTSSVERLARTAAQAALKNGADLAQVHVSAGRVKMIFDWDWNGAEKAGANALALDPGSISAHLFRASLLYACGGLEEAKEICHTVLRRDPLSRAANLQLAACLYAARDFNNATEQCWNVLTLFTRFAPAQLLLALSYEQMAMYEEALVEF